MSDSAVHVLQPLNFERSIMVDLHNLGGSLFDRSLQGTNLAWFIVNWAMTLRWPSHDAVFDPMTHPGMAISWGVSWFELYVNFFFVLRDIYLFVFPARLRMLSMLITFRMKLRFCLQTNEMQ